MITIEGDAILDAIHHARTHLHRADQAALYCLQADRNAEANEQPWVQGLWDRETKKAGQHVSTEQNEAIDAITQLITQAIGQGVSITGAQE